MDYTLSHCPCTLSLLQVLIAELEKAEALAKRLHRETLEASSAVAAQIEAETRALADTTNTAIKQRGHTAPGLCLKQLTALDSLRRLLKPRTKYLVSEFVCVCVRERERERATVPRMGAHTPIRLQEGLLVISDSQRKILSKSWEKVTSPEELE
jgi:hypothetical protein